MADSTIQKMFWLMALLIIVTYFVGAATDTNALAAGLTKIWYAATGRNSSGNTSAYPSGGGNVQ